MSVLTRVSSGSSLWTQERVVAGIAALLVGLLGVVVPGFLTVANLLTLLRGVSALAIFGIAMALVVIGRGLDLSLVASAGVATATALMLMNRGWSTGSALLVGLAVVVFAGLVTGVLVVFVEIPPLFLTLATGLLSYGLAQTFWISSFSQELPPGRTFLLYLGQGRPVGVPMPVLICAGVALAAHLVIRRLSLGWFVVARGANPDAAALTGLPLRPLTVAQYVIAPVLGYLAGLVMAGTTDGFTTTIITSTFIYDVLLVVVIGGVSLVGGRGGVPGVLAGTLLIGVLLNGMTLLDFDVEQQNVAKGIVLLAALALDRKLHPRDEETARQGE